MATAQDKTDDKDDKGAGHTGKFSVNTLARKLLHRSEATVRERVSQVRISFILALQAGVAAALAWVLAHEVIGNPSPVFAPIAAVGTLAASVGQRLRRTGELVIGVALGIGVGDLLIILLGTGPWQLGLIVFLAIITAVFLGAGPGGVTQAAATGVLIATLKPSVEDVEFSRVIDALVGGIVGLTVLALLLPLNPLRIVSRASRPALNALAEELIETAGALERRDARRADVSLDRIRRVAGFMDQLGEALEGGQEAVTLAPVRWHRRGELRQYVESTMYVNLAVHNSGTLVRRAVTLLEDGEPVPRSLPSAVALLAEAVRSLHHELSAGTEPKKARQHALQAVSEAGRAYDDGVGFSGAVVVAQVRTTASDLIQATGIEKTEAYRMVRRAAISHRDPDARPAAEPTPEPVGNAGAADAR